jgi:dienelactone hydrolase
MLMALISAALADTQDPAAQLRQGYFHTEEAAVAELGHFRTLWSNEAEWEERASLLKRKLLEGAGLSPLPMRTPLKPIIHSKRVYDGYSVESIALEALPGYHVIGSLYRPVGKEGPYAGILCPHGHGYQPNGGGRFRPANQTRCAVLAQMGAVVFSYDMVGFGDSGLLGWEHKQIQSMPLQLWSSMRIVDYLTALPDVDADRIAVTGASGGGTQSFMLAAVDDRVAVTVPTVQVSAHFFGGCICESGRPIHSTDEHKTSNVEIAALAAPRPQLIISDGDDWTKNTPHVEYPYISEVYLAYGKPHLVNYAHFGDEKHDYGPSKRQAAYPFLARHLKLDEWGVLKADGTYDESRVTIEPWEQMRTFSDTHPLPSTALKPNSLVPIPRN